MGIKDDFKIFGQAAGRMAEDYGGSVLRGKGWTRDLGHIRPEILIRHPSRDWWGKSEWYPHVEWTGASSAQRWYLKSGDRMRLPTKWAQTGREEIKGHSPGAYVRGWGGEEEPAQKTEKEQLVPLWASGRLETVHLQTQHHAAGFWLVPSNRDMCRIAKQNPISSYHQFNGVKVCFKE